MCTYRAEMTERRKVGVSCTVIGGCGFLGRHICEKLVKSGYTVKVFDLRKTFEDDRMTFYTGDLCKKEDLLPALRGSDVVFHCASPAPSSNNKDLFYKVNVTGTKTLIQACKEAGIKKFILTSSASVVYSGEDIENGTEDLPYAGKPLDYYTETKILQEKLVLAANSQVSGSEPFMTVAIRPHGIFGPRDPQCVPTIVKTGRAGKMKFIIGNGKNIVDFTYVDNVVHGHLLAAEHLHGTSALCGQAYNITNDSPLPFWKFIGKILKGFSLQEPSIKVPYLLIYFFSVLLHYISVVLSPLVTIRPTFTPSRVALAGTHHYYNCTKAKTDFGYCPIVNFEEGVQRAIDHVKREEQQLSN